MSIPVSRFISSNIRTVNVDLACTVGLNGALVLQQVYYWLEKSKHAHDGRVWVYNTYDEWRQQFPWWSERTIQRIFIDLEEQGLLVVGNYNKMKIDRTKWYSIDFGRVDEVCDHAIKVTTSTRQADDTHGDKLTPPITKDYQETTTKTTTPDTRAEITRCLSSLFPGLNNNDIGSYAAAYHAAGHSVKEIERKHKRITTAWEGTKYSVSPRSLLNNWSKIDGEPDIDEAEYWAGADYS